MAAAWAHLPNKIHIDQVLGDLKNHPDLFLQAYNLEYDQARVQAWDQAHHRAYSQARDQAWDQAWNQARDHALVHAYYVAQDALLALIAYDDASKYLTIPIDQAMVYGELLSDNQYILLKPYLLIKHEIALLATA
jgi:hypothetical protein